MVIVVSIVGKLACHVLSHILQGTFPSQPLPTEQLELAASALYTVPAAIHVDPACLGEGELCFTVAERLSQRDNAALFSVDRNAQLLKLADNGITNLAQLIHIWTDDAIIIRIVSSTVHAQLALEPVVHRRRQRPNGMRQ